jgi:RNA recognition motif-containing protein
MAAPNTNYYEQPPPGGKQQAQGGQQQNEPALKKRVYIGNLPPETTREELRELGSKYGRVISVELIRTKDGRLPFGFITFLSEEDAGYTQYMLDDHVYKNYPLEASLSNKEKQKSKPGTPRSSGGTAAGVKTKEKKKKPMYSLRTLTPLNPPTQTNQAAQPPMKNYTQNLNDDQGFGSPNLGHFPGWTDNPAEVPQAPLGRGSNPGQNNQDFNNQQQQQQGANRKGNNNNNRNRQSGGTFKRAQDTQFVGDEVRDDEFDNPEQIPIVQDTPPALNQLPPQEPKRQNQKGQNRNTNNPKGGQQQKNKLGSNSGGPQTVNASIQYTQGGPTSNVQVNVATQKKISLNFKLNMNQLDEFLNVIQPYVQEETQ